MTLALLLVTAALLCGCAARQPQPPPPLPAVPDLVETLPHKTISIEVSGPQEGLPIWINGVYSGAVTPDFVSVATGDLVYAQWFGNGACLVRGDEQYISFSIEETEDVYELLLDRGNGIETIGFRFKRWVSPETFVEMVESQPELSVVDLGRCVDIADLEPLADKRNLIALSLWQSPAEDLRPLAGLTNLRALDLRETGFDDISALSGLNMLAELYLNLSAVSDLRPLSGMTRLRRLDLRDAPVVDLQPLAALSELRVLMLGGTNISDISVLANFINLEWLSLAWTQVGDITPLFGLTKLSMVSFLGLAAPETQINEFSAAHPECEVFY